MKIFVIRHPQTYWNLERKLQGHLDSDLTQFGIETANKLAENLKNKNITKIISSDLGRCKKTADIVGEKLNLNYKTDKLLRERNFGDYNAEYKDELIKIFDFHDFDLVPPNGESIKQMSGRSIEFINNFQEKYNLTEKDNILLVTHHGIVLSLLYYSENKNDIEFYPNMIGEFELEYNKLSLINKYEI